MSTFEIIVAVAAGITAYIVIAGAVYAALPSVEQDTRDPAAALWPLAAAIALAWWLATLAPRWIKKREDARRIPRAEVRK